MLKGTLDDFSLPDVFRLMSLAKKTGRLDVQRKAGNGKVYFREGEVYYAESSLSREPLGQKLIRSGALTEGGLRKALDLHSDTGERVGDILVNTGTVTLEQIATAVSQQIEDSVFDLLRWELGDFTWEPSVEVDVEIPISVSVENLIMESSRRLDELEVIKRKIPSMAAILAMAPKPPEGALEINITPEEWRVLVLVDGSRSVADIAGMVGLDEFGAMRTMYGLVSSGLVEVVETGEEFDEAAFEGEHVETAWAEEPAPAARPAPKSKPRARVETPAVPAEPLPAVAEVESGVDAAEQETLVVAEESPTELESPLPVAAEPELPEPVAAAPATSAEPVAEAPVEAALEELLTQAEAEPEPEPVAAAPPEEWFEDPDVAVEAFDAPGPDDLVTEVPDPLEAAALEEAPAAPEAPADAEVAEPEGVAEAAEQVAAADDTFLDDLLDDEDAAPAASEEPPEPPEAPEPPPAADEEAPRVDRAAVVRELAGLFSDEEKQAARPRPPAPRPEAPRQEGDERKRVEDDDQVTKGLISRLIDGVKGL